MPHVRRSRSRSKELSNSDASSEAFSDYSRRSRSRSRSHSVESVYRLHIADIGENVKKSDLEKVFGEFGGLKEIWIANSPPCFGFVVFKHKSQAIAALKATDGLMLCGGRIHVTHARPRTRGLGRRYYNPNMRCYECGIPGHFYRDCPELYERNHGSSKFSRRNYYSSSRRRNSYGRSERRYSPDRDRSPEDRHRRR